LVQQLLSAKDTALGKAKLRSSKYLNNMIEQGHRDVKPRIGPMPGFKRFKCAAITIAGIELMLACSAGCMIGTDQYLLNSRLPSHLHPSPQLKVNGIV
jgi:hypothetical protein